MKLSHRIARVTGFAVIVLFGLNTGCGQPEGEAYIRQHYRKAEYRIPMRDGVKLHTAVFSPRNTSQKYPFLMMRTPYGCRPYGDDKYPDRISLNPELMGKAVGLSPVAILLGIFIWGKLLGFLGLLLAIPLTCLGIAYYRRFVLHLSKDEDPVTAATKAMQTAPAEVESKLTPAADITPPAPKKDKKKG